MTKKFKAGDKAMVLPVNSRYAFEIVEIIAHQGAETVYPLLVRTHDNAAYPMHELELQHLPIPCTEIE